MTTVIEPSARDAAAETLRSALLEIATNNDNALPPAAIVEAARDEDSPLHQYFEWDDAIASEAYRIIQARGLIRRVRLTVIREARGTKVVDVAVTRQFQSRPSMRKAELGYESVDAIMSDEEKRAEMLAQAKKELRAIQKRYAELAELAPIWSAIDQVKP